MYWLELDHPFRGLRRRSFAQVLERGFEGHRFGSPVAGDLIWCSITL